jgi:hypothetical protein
MTTQSVMAQATGSFAGVKGSVTSKNRQAGTGFEALLGKSMKAGKTASGVTEGASGAKKAVSDKGTDTGSI